MQCPLDNTELVMTDRQGIEIDYCPKCRGVWLDRGELDKIIERSAPEEDRQPRRDDERYARPEQRSYRGDDYHYKKKKKSILGDIFDF